VITRRAQQSGKRAPDPLVIVDDENAGGGLTRDWRRRPYRRSAPRGSVM
jgi:hypothetical protein